jgi:gas vesicle protein
MNRRNGFGSGFILGSIVGGVVGGILGTLLATREKQQEASVKQSLQQGREVAFNPEESIEVARRSLEDKIAQLNLAIDDVRQQLNSVDRNSSE